MAINTNNIQKYHTSHDNGNGGGGGVTYVRGSVNNASLPSELNVTKISAALGTINDLSGNSLNYNTGNFVYLNGMNGTVTKLSGQQLNYAIGTINDLSADNIRAGKITVDELEATKAWIENLNSRYITTEYLTVTNQAHFFELIIDKVKSVGGTIINTAANAVLDYVKAFKEDANHQYVQTTLDDPDAAYYDVFWLAQESNGRKVTNDWMANDQAFCQSFNVAAGVNYNVSSKYYWRLVDAVLADRYMNLNTGDELPLGEQETVPTAATENAVIISDPRIMVEGPQGTTTILEGFQVNAQQIVGIQTGAAWTGGQQGPQGGMQGVMTTTNTIFGIEIKPDAGTQAASFVPDKFALECSSSRLNVGLYFKDDTSLYYPAPETARTHYEYDLGWIDTTGPQGAQTIKPDNSLEAIVITNADEVQWKMVHGIRLSNTVKDDNVPTGPQGQQAWYANVPTAGDNIAQLGYRFTTADDPNRTRASAQILAAYKTPDNGYQTPSDPNYKAPLAPPSYAQYTDINDFHLGKHRKSYIDANGAAFIGNLYNGSGVSVEDMIGHQVSTPYYLHIAYANSADGRDDFTKVPVEGISYSHMGFQSNQNPSDALLIYSDYDWSLVPGGTGANGGHWEYAYCNYKPTTDQTTPAKPTTGTDVDHLPSGWTKTPSTPDFANGYFTFMSQCFVSGSTGAYGTWTDPVRITGDNGKDGEDGESLEFIYKHFTSQQIWTDNNLNPAYWEPSQNPDYTGPSGYQWSDNPQGVQADTMFEYMSQRKYDGHQWGKFTTPVIWSKWGENGKDGDGYEYIFKHFAGPQTWATNNWNPAYWNAVQEDEYLGPQSGGTDYRWNDDPQGISSGFQVEYVAMRKKTDGTWGKYNEPTVWAQWNEGVAGPQGAQGSAGPPGEGSIQYQLVSEGTQAGVKMGFDTNNKVTEILYLKPMFRVLKIENGQASYMTQRELKDKGLNGYILIDQSEDATNRSPLYYQLTRRTDVNYALLQWPDGSYTSTNETIIKYNAMSQVILINSSASTISPSSITGVIDAYSLPVGLFPEATFSTVQGTNASIKSLVTDYQTINNELNGTNGIQNRLSLVEQTASGIQTTVAALTTTTSGARNLIMNGAFKLTPGNQYWSNWQDSGVAPTKREIVASNGSQWMHIISTGNISGGKPNYQGYAQQHYNDYGITIEGGNKYTISLRAKTNTGNATICTILHYYNGPNGLYERANQSTGNSRLQRTLSWNIDSTDRTYTATFDVPAKGYIYNSGAYIDVNTFKIMVGDNTTTAQNFYITDITLVKGSIPAAWSPAPEETDAALNGLTTEVTRISVQANGIQSDVTREFQNMSLGGANLINGTQTLKSTYTTTYGTPSLSNGISSEGLYGVVGSYTGDTINLIKYEGDNEIAVQADTEYVMSFWAKGTGQLHTFFRSGSSNNPMVVTPYFYNEGSQGTNGFSSDGGTTFTLTSNWKRYWIKYKTVASLPTPTAYIIFGRLSDQDAYARVCGPKLEEGNIPGEWEPSVFDGHQFTSSTIKQTADEILLQVGECGINIDNHSITLNGETEINGSLTLHDDNQGFLIMDPTGAKGQTQITPKSIGTYGTFSGNANSLSPVGKSYDIMMRPSSNGLVYGTWTTTNTFNNIPSGKTITLQDYNARFMIPGTGTVIYPPTPYSSYVTATWQIYDNGTLRKTIKKYSLRETILDTYTKNSNGQLKIVFTVSAYIQASTASQSSNIINGAIVYRMNVPQDAFTLIGYDGIGLNFGNDKTAYFGADGTYFKYGNFGIRVTSSGLQKTTNGTTWVDL